MKRLMQHHEDMVKMHKDLPRGQAVRKKEKNKFKKHGR